ncbi:hypothetical protein P7K49_000138 [Saguinus oedipus]|uniref:Uncharacterized protein n=1 Tax=Saguinus oedipus TaxID=9490 RepID=A0ABQ9WAW4_SAGOE|nr:hypothetical protein P7K49_000138 [Saguinus oedipus]
MVDTASATISSSPAIDYSDSAMLQAQQLLLGLGSFLEDARAYMKGQLACGSVRDVVLWERLSSTKRAVKAALADDFDTPRVVDAVLGLVHHGNGELRATPKVAQCARGLAVPSWVGSLLIAPPTAPVEGLVEPESAADRRDGDGAGRGPTAACPAWGLTLRAFGHLENKLSGAPEAKILSGCFILRGHSSCPYCTDGTFPESFFGELKKRPIYPSALSGSQHLGDNHTKPLGV